MKNTIKDVLRIILLSLISLFVAAILMEVSLIFLVSQPHLKSNEKLVFSSGDHEHPKQPAPAHTSQTEKVLKKQPRCETNYFAIFKQEQKLLCAEIEYPPTSGPPPKLFYSEGLVITESDLAEFKLCRCVASQASYQETLHVKRVSNIHLSGTELPIEKWVCGDLCQNQDQMIQAQKNATGASDSEIVNKLPAPSMEKNLSSSRKEEGLGKSEENPFWFFNRLQEAFQQDGVFWIYEIFLISLTPSNARKFAPL